VRRTRYVLLAAAAVLASSLSASAQTGRADPCGAGLRVAAQAEDHVVCSHGPDPLSDLGLTTEPAPPAPCVGDGVSGPRVHLVYGVPSDRPYDYDSKVSLVRGAADAADLAFETSDSDTTQHLRWLCTNGTLRVDSAVLAPVGADGVFTFADMYNSLARTKGKKGSASPFKDPNHVYVVFVDGLDSSSYPYCGQGQVENDDSPGVTNRNNSGPAYSLIACWDGETTLHEIGHNLGAVQHSAPHSSGAFHCYDESDVMCYDDEGPYFAGPDRQYGTTDDRPLVQACAGPGTLLGGAVEDRQFDCNQDDYYDPTPAAGSYLATHWNIADSAWVEG